jgi:ribonucleoside-diphosphate reductase alpha chain
MKKPNTLPSRTVKVPTGHGNLYITITELNGKPDDVFCTIGKSGGSIMAKAEVTGRLTSLALRNGVSLRAIVDQLIDISGDHQSTWRKILIKSIPDAVGRVLEELYLEGGDLDGL